MKEILLVVSAENNAYLGWQAELLCWTARERLGCKPVVMAHGAAGAPLDERLARLERRGLGHVARVRSYRTRYHPRNFAGSVLEAGELADIAPWVAVLDPDMTFRSDPSWLPEVAAQDYPYLYASAPSPALALGSSWREVAEACGVDWRRAEAAGLPRCGVPYLLPTARCRELGERWLAILDRLEPERFGNRDPGIWELVMYAGAWALTDLGLAPRRLDDVSFLTWRDRRPLLHYCDPHPRWDKREFRSRAADDVWRAKLRGLPEGGSAIEQLAEDLCAASPFRMADCEAC